MERDSIGLRLEPSALWFSLIREAPSLLTVPDRVEINDERVGLTRLFSPEDRTDRSVA